MSEFIEVPISRENGSEAVQYVNLGAVSYIETDPSEQGDLRVYLNNGYWFTLSGTAANEALKLIKSRLCLPSKRHAGAG